jgi:G3E family GTPase
MIIKELKAKHGNEHHHHHHHDEDCDCEECKHEHEHHHDHDCCEHEHHHHHDEDCDCEECKHEHEHHHDHDCCEHEHHHEHDCCDHDHEHHHDHDADEVFASFGKETVLSYSKEELENVLKALASGEYGIVLRSKGVLKASDNDSWYYFDYVAGDYDIKLGTPDVIGKLCVIGSDINKEKIEIGYYNPSKEFKNDDLKKIKSIHKNTEYDFNKYGKWIYAQITRDDKNYKQIKEEIETFMN